MGKRILVLSKDKGLLSFLKSIYPNSELILADRNFRPSLSLHPEIIIHLCNYNCYQSSCLRQFTLSRFYGGAEFKIIRPVLTQINTVDQRYIIQSFHDDKHYRATKETLKQLFINSYGMHKAFLIENFIISNYGKIKRIIAFSKEIKLSNSYLSKLFHKYTKMNLKLFINTINLCFCLWECITSAKPIKAIALDNGYSPITFSVKFKNKFQCSPGEARHRSINTILYWFEKTKT
ncbi:MAG: helix-turn-helix domain-containing protein [Candidatus Saccharicenans sp.]